jgi:hypothetical protein
MELPTKQCRICNDILPVTSFNKHSGTKDKLDSRCKECMKECKKKSKLNEAKTYPVYPLDLTNTDWQVGKPMGSILQREEKNSGAKRYEVRVPLGNGALKSKSFPFSDDESQVEAEQDAKQWLTQFSKENGLTKNMIRVLDENTIEVQLTQGKILKTDMQFADICQAHCLCVAKSGNPTAEYYVSASINNQPVYFHKHITGNNMTDHINRDPMDNRLCNLQATTHKLNNNNRGMNKKYLNNPDHILGVRYVEKDQAWQARIKQNGKEYTKSFSVKKFGHEGAKELAITTRKTLGNHFQCAND